MQPCHLPGREAFVGPARNFTTSQYEFHSLSYTTKRENSDGDATLEITTNTMSFVVCPHAHYYGSGVPCETYVAWLGIRTKTDAHPGVACAVHRYAAGDQRDHCDGCGKWRFLERERRGV